MTNFFKNTNAHSVVVERVPCAFAKPKSGEPMGTHYTVVIFDKNQSVLYVGSECEHVHGESVQALHEMGGQTCFSITAKFRAALGRVNTLRGQSISTYKNDLGELQDVSPLMRAAFNTTKNQMINVHNERVQPTKKEVSANIVALQKLVDKLTQQMLSLPLVIDEGRHKQNVTTSQKQEVKVPRVLKVEEHTYTYAFDHAGMLFPSGSYLRLSPANDYETFAIKEHGVGGRWLVDEQKVRQFANNNHTSIATPELDGLKISKSKCVFCGETYERMSKHTHGLKHKNRVVDVVKLVCKAISPTGLRMLNNPRYSATFFRPL